MSVTYLPIEQMRDRALAEPLKRKLQAADAMLGEAGPAVNSLVRALARRAAIRLAIEVMIEQQGAT